jgi:hypothetical protein
MIRDAYYGPEVAKAVNFVFTPEYDVNDSISRFDKLLKHRTDGIFVYTQLTDPRALEDMMKCITAGSQNRKILPSANARFALRANPSTPAACTSPPPPATTQNT